MKKLAVIVSSIICIFVIGTACSVPFQATWYLVRDGAENTSTMHIVVLNQSSERQFVENVILNHMTIDGKDMGWQLKGPGRYLDPGEVISRPITRFSAISQGTSTSSAWQCRVPLSVEVVTEGHASKLAKMAGVMPNRLIEDWEKGCPKEIE